MSDFHAFLYGLVQGATEYLPVSSSAHLLLFPHFLGERDPGLAFDVILHVGTLLATAVYFFKDWLKILKNPMPKTSSRHLSWLHLLVATLPAVIVGALLNAWIKENTRSVMIVVVTLPLFGLLLWAMDLRQAKREAVLPAKSTAEARIKDVLIIGLFQCLALIPGVSRSGSTMTAARILSFSRKDAARISFLISLPITLGAIVFELRHFDEIIASVNGLSPLVVGCISAFVFGALAIHGLIVWVGKAGYGIFAIYRVALAALVYAILT